METPTDHLDLSLHARDTHWITAARASSFIFRLKSQRNHITINTIFEGHRKDFELQVGDNFFSCVVIFSPPWYPRFKNQVLTCIWHFLRDPAIQLLASSVPSPDFFLSCKKMWAGSYWWSDTRALLSLFISHLRPSFKLGRYLLCGPSLSISSYFG